MASSLTRLCGGGSASFLSAASAAALDAFVALGAFSGAHLSSPFSLPVVSGFGFLTLAVRFAAGCFFSCFTAGFSPTASMLVSWAAFLLARFSFGSPKNDSRSARRYSSSMRAWSVPASSSSEDCLASWSSL